MVKRNSKIDMKETRRRVKLLEDTLGDFWAEIVTLYVKHGYDLNGRKANDLYEDFEKAMRYPLPRGVI